jgi:hypothetical protein
MQEQVNVRLLSCSRSVLLLLCSAFLRPYLFSGLSLNANHLLDFGNNFDQVFLVFHYCLD